MFSDPEGARNEYQMSGIPDGLGAYKSDKGMLKVLMNHELDGTPPDSPEGVGARVSRLSLDPETLTVQSASYPITGREGFLRFCSATISYIDGKPLYCTGEESTDEGSLTDDTTDGLGRGGSSIVLNTKSGENSETRHFGLLPHENIVPVKGLARDRADDRGRRYRSRGRSGRPQRERVAALLLHRAHVRGRNLR